MPPEIDPNAVVPSADRVSVAQSELKRLLTRPDYRATVPKPFPSDQALAWFIRRHKDRLLRGGAIVYINRRQFIDPVRMDPIVLEIAHAA